MAAEFTLLQDHLCQQLLEGHSEALKQITGPAFMHVIADGDEIETVIEEEDDFCERLDATIADSRRNSDEKPLESELKLAQIMKRVWKNHDHDEMVPMLIHVNERCELKVILKPWVDNPHAHCPCGTLSLDKKCGETCSDEELVLAQNG